jgi:hypothetical protein
MGPSACRWQAINPFQLLKKRQYFSLEQAFCLFSACGHVRNTSEKSISSVVFGAPTFVLNEEISWGGDRMDALLWWLDNPAADNTTLEQFLLRGASAQRRN